MMRFLHSVVQVTFALVITGCSGGGSSSPAAPPIADNGGSGSNDTASACDAAAQIDFVEEVVDSW